MPEIKPIDMSHRWMSSSRTYKWGVIPINSLTGAASDNQQAWFKTRKAAEKWATSKSVYRCYAIARRMS
jgi:hypothetical protein